MDYLLVLVSKIVLSLSVMYLKNIRLINFEGNVWKKHRHIINPSFNMATLRSYQPIYNSHSKRIVESLEKVCSKGSVDPSKYCKRFIADVVTGNYLH